jgi:hypothetical protein
LEKLIIGDPQIDLEQTDLEQMAAYLRELVELRQMHARIRELHKLTIGHPQIDVEQMNTRVGELLELYMKAPMIFDENAGEWDYDLGGDLRD